jgi:hypothetical protein
MLRWLYWEVLFPCHNGVHIMHCIDSRNQVLLLAFHVQLDNVYVIWAYKYLILAWLTTWHVEGVCARGCSCRYLNFISTSSSTLFHTSRTSLASTQWQGWLSTNIGCFESISSALKEHLQKRPRHRIDHLGNVFCSCRICGTSLPSHVLQTLPPNLFYRVFENTIIY